MASKTNEEKLAEAMALEPVSYLTSKPFEPMSSNGTRYVYMKTNFYNKKGNNISFQQFCFHGEGAEKDWEEFEKKNLSSVLEKKESKTSKSADEIMTENKKYVSDLNKDKQPGDKGRFDQYCILSEIGGDTIGSSGRINISIAFSSSSSNIILPAKKMTFSNEEALIDFKKFLKNEKFKLVLDVKKTSGGRNYRTY